MHDGPDRAAVGPTPSDEPIEVPVCVVFERSNGPGPWSRAAWRVAAVLPDEGAGELRIGLHRDEAAGYWLNLTTDEPSIFVKWRPWQEQEQAQARERAQDEAHGQQRAAGAPEPVAVTVSYDEAGRWMDGGEQVDRVPMPGEMAAWLGEFVALHYRPERGRKRRGAKPSFMSRDEFERMAERERGPGRS